MADRIAMWCFLLAAVVLLSSGVLAVVVGAGLSSLIFFALGGVSIWLALGWSDFAPAFLDTPRGSNFAGFEFALRDPKWRMDRII